MSDPQKITLTDIKCAIYKKSFSYWLSDDFIELVDFNMTVRNPSEFLELFDTYFDFFNDLINQSNIKNVWSLKHALTVFSKKKGCCAAIAKNLLKEPLTHKAKMALEKILCPIVVNNFNITCKPEYSSLDQEQLEKVLIRFFVLLSKFTSDKVKFTVPFTYVKPQKIESRTDFSDHILVTHLKGNIYLELRDLSIDQKKHFMLMDLDSWSDVLYSLKLTNCTLDYERFCQDYFKKFIMENCTINQPAIMGSYLEKDETYISDVILNNCVIKSDLKYHSGGRLGSITLNNCIIESSGSVEIKEVKEPFLLAKSLDFMLEHMGEDIPNPYEGENTLNEQHINIKNCIFKGKLDCSDSYFDSCSAIQYTTFYDNFIFKGTRFDKDCIIEHLAFPTIDNANTNKGKKILLEALEASGRTENELIQDKALKDEEKLTWGAGFAKERDKHLESQLSEELEGLVNQLKNNNKVDEDSEYNEQIKRNRITTKNAARYLGIGVSTLEKKRANDKKKITQDSIPCILVNGTIYYRKDALDAYMFGQNCSDWGLLAELQAKYKEVWKSALDYKKK